MLMAFDHVSLTVTDVDTSVEWYRSVLELSVVADFEGDGFRRVRLRPETGAVTVTLTAHHHGSGDGFSERRTGLDHVAFHVGGIDELEAAKRRFEELGVDHSEIKPRERQPGGRAMVTLRDPDHIQLEVVADGP